MQEILYGYELTPTTWAYISSLMLIGTYFKFHRFWSVRNLDLVGLIAFTPALLLVFYGLKKNPDLIQAGYVWLFAVSGFFLVRLLLDPVMVRRPLLEPNLSASGLTFTGVSLLVFLMANVITGPPERLERMLPKQELSARPNPGYEFFYTFSGFSKQKIADVDRAQPEAHRQATIRSAATRTVTILAHLAVVIGMVWIGFRHFGNIHTGVAAATLYLLTFYTSQFTSQMDHVVPAMLLVWAVAAYRLPVIAGILLGLAAGMIYYPLFLLPLWCGFYWRRGWSDSSLAWRWRWECWWARWRCSLPIRPHSRHMSNRCSAGGTPSRPLRPGFGNTSSGPIGFRWWRPSWWFPPVWPSGRCRRTSARF